ncbi:hypothetical protein [Burkholderia ubonensis]|uniref:hypothetical protein n=1 Tax=Burkholderia ubonensis TaxID=101571 RepID=UPI000F56A269|nr:hypothetical protein [Burkholderia ubonensis]
MSDHSDSTVKSLGIFSTLQAATETKFFLLSASFTLLIDNALLILREPGLIDLAKRSDSLTTSNFTLQVILIFVAFSFLSSLAIPISVSIFDQIYINTIGSWITSLDVYLDNKIGVEKKFPQREVNYVRPWELRDEAHRSMEKYYLDLYKEYTSTWNKTREDMMQFALHAFFCLSMLSASLYLSHKGKKSIANAVTDYFGTSTPIWISLLFLAIMVIARFYLTKDTEWIYCPNLYDKIEAKTQKLKQY